MKLMLNDAQFQKLGSIINDINNSKGSEYNATSICQISDILFDESEESKVSNKCSCNPENNNNNNNNNFSVDEESEAEDITSCEEKTLLIKAGFSACIRAFKFEGFTCQVTIARVIRILRRFLKGVSIIYINCNLHKEMIEGLSVIFGMIPDFNILRVLQVPLKNYLFWCYTQSEDDYVINNSRILLCVITWMRDISNGNNNNCSNNGQKYGLTLSSQELLNFLISDFNSSTEQFQQESKLSLSSSNSCLTELKKRILRNLELFSILIIYSGVYLPQNSNISNPSFNFFNTGGNIENTCKKEAGGLVTTLITPQIMQVLGNLRIIILEEVYKVVDEFVGIYLERDSGNLEISLKVEEDVSVKVKSKSSTTKDLKMDNNKFTQLIKERILTCLISDIFDIRNSSNKLKNKKCSFPSLVNDNYNVQSDHKLYTKIEYVLMLSNLYQEIFENLLKVSEKTGLVVYSHMIQEHLISTFSLEYIPSTYYKFQNDEISQFLFKNYYSAITFGFGLVPESNFNDFDFQIFFSFNASLKVLEYFEKLFQEIIALQELSIELTSADPSSKGIVKALTQFSTYKDLIITKLICQKLASLLLTYNLSNNIIIGLRYTNVAKEFRQSDSCLSLDSIINKCHFLSSKVLLNLIVKNGQLFNLNPLGIQNIINSDPQLKVILFELIYQISNTISEYYQDPEIIPNSTILNNMNEIFNCLKFILDYNLKDEKLETMFNFFSSKLYSNSNFNDKDKDDSNALFSYKNMNKALIKSSPFDFSKKDLLYLEYKDEDFITESNNRPECTSTEFPSQEQQVFIRSSTPPPPSTSSSSSSSSSTSSLQDNTPIELKTSSMEIEDEPKSDSENNLKFNENTFQEKCLEMDDIDLNMNLESSSGED